MSRPVGVILLGKDSDVQVQANHKRANARIFSKDEALITSEEAEKSNIEMITELTVGWRNIEIGGVSEFSAALVAQMYRDQKWSAEQATQFIVDRSNFI